MNKKVASDFGIEFKGFAAVRIKTIEEFPAVDTSDLKMFLEFKLWRFEKGRIVDRVFRMI